MKRRTIYIFIAIALACLMLGILAGISINSYSYNVLNGFVTSGDAVHSANLQIEKVIDDKIASLESDTIGISSETREKIDSLKMYADKMVAFVYNMRLELVRSIDGEDAQAVQEAMARPDHYLNAASIAHKDEVSGTMYYMYNQRNVSILTSELEEYRENILSLVECKNYEDSSAVRNQIGLKMDHVNGRIWGDNLFDGAMLISASVAFDQIVGDVRNAEYEMLRMLEQSAEFGDYNIQQ